MLLYVLHGNVRRLHVAFDEVVPELAEVALIRTNGCAGEAAFHEDIIEKALHQRRRSIGFL